MTYHPPSKEYWVCNECYGEIGTPPKYDMITVHFTVEGQSAGELHYCCHDCLSVAAEAGKSLETNTW
jgi:hypothetical protein